MILTTTSVVDGLRVHQYLGVVTGEAILGANIVRDIFAAVTDVVGGRSGAYETKLRQARETALREMQEEAQALGANAILGIDLDYDTVREGMLMVTVSGTAVRLE